MELDTAIYHLNQACSTPYGNQRKIILSTVLNLTRGSPCSTPYGNQRKIIPTNWLGPPWVNYRAQRLTAIRGKSCCHSPSLSWFLLNSAQRLTAIRGKSYRLGGKNKLPDMCSTPYGNQRKIMTRRGRDPDGRRYVLNALRQSEENHSERIELTND